MTFRQHKVNVVRHDDTGLHTKQAIRQIQTTYFLLHDTSLRRRLPRPVTDMPQEAGVISYAECHEIIPIRTIIKMAEPHGATLKFRIFHLTKISVSPDMPATATVYLQKYTTTGPGGTPVAGGIPFAGVPLCRSGTGRHKWRPYRFSTVRPRRGDIHVARMTGQGLPGRADAAGIGRITHIQKKPPVRGTFVPSHPEALDEAVRERFVVPCRHRASQVAPPRFPRRIRFDAVGATFMSPG